MEFRIFKGLVILSFILTLSSCKKNNNDGPLGTEDIMGISYGTHEQQTFDVYLPEGRSDTTKVIILLHGGWWVEGDKDSLTTHAMSLRDSGFAVVNMNYRLADTSIHIHPAQQQDITNVVNFISSKAIDWRVSTSKFGLLGVSAGGHLALLYTYGHNANNKIKTVVSIGGPTNFTPSDNPNSIQAAAVENFLGESFDPLNYSKYIQASPIAKVSLLSRPTLLIHGESDDIVPVKQAEDLEAKLNQFDIYNEVVLLPTGHDVLKDTTDPKEIYSIVTGWFKAHIK